MSGTGANAHARVRALVDLGRWQQARDAATIALAGQPDDAQLMGWLAQAELGLGNPTAAHEAAQQMTVAHPNSEWAHRLRSLALERLERGEEAIAAAREAVRCGPHVAASHQRLAQALGLRDPSLPGRRARLREAGEAAAESLRLAPNSADAHFTAGYVAQRSGRVAAARTEYRRTLALAPDHSVALNNLTTLKGFNAVRAADGFMGALRTDPGSKVAQRNLHKVAGMVGFNIFAAGALVLAVTRIVDTRQAPANPLSILIALSYVTASAFYVKRAVRRLPRQRWTSNPRRMGPRQRGILISISIVVIVVDASLTDIGGSLGQHAFVPLAVALSGFATRWVRVRGRG